jgi:Cdc6-like AAA superfamily ATPase
MRLLHYTDDRELGWTDLIADDKLPPYAILSHTWGGQEVTFDDLQSHKGKDKAGFKKIQFCAQQAERDSLHYFWVDTCCIDKSSSAELSEAINSMFRWYHNAERCYVYLADVSSSSSDGDGEETRRWKPAFRKSRWFTRGWTLQELIAPTSVEFFSKEEERLGDKKSLEQTIHEITGIPLKALRGSPPSEFSKDDRFSWAASRQTTRKEDEAYCLLGIFDLQIPLLYGEGREKATKRLQKEVWGDLPASPAHDVQSDSRRRDETADKIHRWLSPPDPSTNYQKALEQRQDDTGLWFLESDRYVKWTTDAASFLWLYGIPGCGKTILSSAILKNVLQHCNNNPQKVVAYFYFDFNDMQKQKPELMLRSLICQLLQQCLKIPASLGTRFSSRGNEQPQQPSLHALVKIMRQIAQELPHVYIVLDALDECSERTKLMDIIETISTWKLQNLHVLVTSRRERDIQSSLAPLIDQKNSICLQSEVVDVDIHRYVQQRLSKDKRLSKWGKDLALSEEIEAALMKGAHGMYESCLTVSI